jgi:hypothetical protein
MSAASAAAAAAASAAALAKAQEEEEDMTPYASQDLADGWEFKILRSVNGRFRDPVWLHGILAEEAQAGWTMLEKFDDTRVRLKRPARANRNDATLGFDPYRTWVGMSQARYTLRVVAFSFAFVGIITAIIIALVFNFAPNVR